MKRGLYKYWFVFYDFMGAALAWVLFFYVRKGLLNEGDIFFTIKPFINGTLIGLFWLCLYALSSFYLDVFSKSRIKEFLNHFLIAIPGVLSVFLLLLLDDEGVDTYKSYYKTLSAYFIIHFVVSVFIKMFVMSYSKYLLRNQIISFNTLIIGAGKKAVSLIEELESVQHSLGMRFVGYIHEEKGKGFFGKSLRDFGGIENIDKVIRRCKVENVIIALENPNSDKAAQILSTLRDYDLKVSISPDMYHVLLGSVKVNHLFGVPLIEVNPNLMAVWQQVLKRVFDIVFSFSTLIIGFPFFLFIGLMTKGSSKGPVFYTQERIGKNNIPFRIIKFRSMYVDAEKQGPALSSDHDPRITPWGKFMRKTRLDELPQFFNVLKGDMSVVGPRPERQYFIDKIVVEAPQYRHLLKVRPGITSLGQVKYGYAENVGEMVKRLQYDLLYIENMSLAMDFRIILFTVLIVIQGRGK